MDIMVAITERRSVRNFSDRKPDSNLIRDMVMAASWAPSSCNKQAWKFIIVDDEKKKEEMVDMGGASIIKRAPAGILVVYSRHSDNTEYSDYIQSGAAAIQNMLLFAHSKGLAACWVCHLPRKKDLRKLFSIPRDYSPIGYVLLGYPGKSHNTIERRYRIDDLMSFNKFDFSDGTLLRVDAGITIKAVIRKLYYMAPTPLKRALNKFIDEKLVKKFEN